MSTNPSPRAISRHTCSSKLAGIIPVERKRTSRCAGAGFAPSRSRMRRKLSTCWNSSTAWREKKRAASRSGAAYSQWPHWMPVTSPYRNWFVTQASTSRSRSGSSRAPWKSNVISSRVSSMWGKIARCVAPRFSRKNRPVRKRLYTCERPPSGYDPPMRRQDEIFELRVPSEALARWALETTPAVKEATGAALAFLVHAEHAATTLLPVPQILRCTEAVLDPDGFLRQPRGAVEHFRLRSARAIAWMDAFIFFREKFPTAAQRQPPDALYSLPQLLCGHGDDLEAATDLLVRECVMPEIEDILGRLLTYPPLQLVLRSLREHDVQRGAEARRLAASAMGDL